MAKRGPKKPKAERGKITSNPDRVLPAPKDDPLKTSKEKVEDIISRTSTPQGRAMVRLTGEEAPRFNPSRRLVEPAPEGGLRFAQVPELVETNPATRVFGPGITSRAAHLHAGAEGARNNMAAAARVEEDSYMYEQLLRNMMKPEAGVTEGPGGRTRMSERRNSLTIPPPGRGIAEVKSWTDKSIIMSDEEKRAVQERQIKDKSEK